MQRTCLYFFLYPFLLFAITICEFIQFSSGAAFENTKTMIFLIQDDLMKKRFKVQRCSSMTRIVHKYTREYNQKAKSKKQKTLSSVWNMHMII